MIKEHSKAWDRASRWLGRVFDPLPLGPHAYTWSTVPSAALGLAAMILGHSISALLLFSLAGLLDVIDGAVARHRAVETPYGAFLDGSLDRVVDVLILLSFYWASIELPWLPSAVWLVIALFVIWMPTFEVAYANHRRAVDDPNETVVWRIMNRGEIYVLELAILATGPRSPRLAGVLFLILVALCAVTSLQTFVVPLRRARRASL